MIDINNFLLNLNYSSQSRYRKDDKESKVGLDLKSSSFTPKAKGPTSSKNIEEFEISNGTSTTKDSATKKLKTTSNTFKPGLKSKAQPFVPGGTTKPNPSLTQSQANPYTYQPVILNA